MGQPDRGRDAARSLAGDGGRRGLLHQLLAGQRSRPPRGLPPGQHIEPEWTAQHYGPVPRFRPETWDFAVQGATASGGECRWRWPAIQALPRCAVTADLHCVTKATIPGIRWEGIPVAELLRLAPPADLVTHVMVWADYGYSANLAIADFAADTTLLATGVAGRPLTPEHGYPLRLVVPHLYGWKSVKWVRVVEYLTADRRGFWEERGYHKSADPWREERFSYQED
jgi:DMSO/TMAO reductase YedYZ molybdopterin-dependent catalytic subunit